MFCKPLNLLLPKQLIEPVLWIVHPSDFVFRVSRGDCGANPSRYFWRWYFHRFCGRRLMISNPKNKPIRLLRRCGERIVETPRRKIVPS